MPILPILRDYLFWHYGVAYVDIVGITRNYLWFVNHLFSVPDVLRSLFSPFKRMKEDKGNIVGRPADFFANLVVNIIMRIVGFIIRFALLTIALASFLSIVALGAATLLVWTILPGLIIYVFISGLNYFFL